jgi:hypothetical protein
MHYGMPEVFNKSNLKTAKIKKDISVFPAAMLLSTFRTVHRM